MHNPMMRKYFRRRKLWNFATRNIYQRTSQAAYLVKVKRISKRVNSEHRMFHFPQYIGLDRQLAYKKAETVTDNSTVTTATTVERLMYIIHMSIYKDFQVLCYLG